MLQNSAFSSCFLAFHIPSEHSIKTFLFEVDADAFDCPEEDEAPLSWSRPALIVALALTALSLMLSLVILLARIGLALRLEWLEAALNGIGGSDGLRYTVYALAALLGAWFAGGALLMAWEAWRRAGN